MKKFSQPILEMTFKTNVGRSQEHPTFDLNLLEEAETSNSGQHTLDIVPCGVFPMEAEAV